MSCVERASALLPRGTTAPGAYIFHGVVDVLAAGLLLLGAAPFASMFDWDVSDRAKPGFPMDEPT